ncbi:DUF5131 family protein [Sphingomonas koreensis]
MTASKIEWTERTWNPIVGCSIHSAGCTNCYAMKMAGRLAAIAIAYSENNIGEPGPTDHYVGTTVKTKAGFVWSGEVNVAPESILMEPLRRKKATTWFVNSMSDLFHESVPDDVIDRVFAVMALCPQHRFQVLTKRADRMREYYGSVGRLFPSRERVWSATATVAHVSPAIKQLVAEMRFGDFVWPLPNVWLGVSVEDQRAVDERIPHLLATPAAVRFLSCEPLLGPVDLASPYTIELWNEKARERGINVDARMDRATGLWDVAGDDLLPGLDWVICGGESGPGARPMHPDWARELRDQCGDAGVPFFFKQWGEFAPGEIAGDYLDPNKAAKGMSYFDGRWSDDWSPVEGHCDDEPDVYLIGKKRAGRKLDGVQHDGMPA